ncbi:deubiquitinase OTUD6B [Bicyclus anynana]|uniref:Deubiquitinase OTUD6B n=1 Tax=Bicyclus anynana TaxID=110368 RepID=A0A6J1NAJ6_BICAN|nr:deubiquitinase OTUD6B [Bicyclus anynana]
MAENNTADDEINLLEQRHKKEKKELQAQIQGLKKTAKNDKTKKKELTAEIVRLESDLEERHRKETEELQNGCSRDLAEPEGSDTEIDTGVTKQKVSKAQKRRNKKLQQERDREKEISLQEQENLHGPRNMENQEMSSRLQERKLKIYPIPSDGDCLYRAVAHQLETKYNIIKSINDLRNDVATYIQDNIDEFKQFMCHPDTGMSLSESEFQEYCNKIRNTKEWGGQVEIRALSNCLKCPITVIQAAGPVAIEQGTEFSGSPLIITYHRHMYSLGEHYNSTQVLNEDD